MDRIIVKKSPASSKALLGMRTEWFCIYIIYINLWGFFLIYIYI